MGNDQFGIKEIYASKPNGEAWYLSSDPENDNRFDPDGNVSENSDGSFSLSNNDQIRMNVFTSSGYRQDDIEDDHGELDIDSGGRGYMQSPNDWTNVEMTGAFNMEKGTNDQLTLGVRGGTHNDSRRCEGFKYGLRFQLPDGEVQFEKEQWHVSYVFAEEQPSPFPNGIRDEWILVKLCIYNVKPAGASRTAVRAEAWVCPSFDKVTWIKAAEFTDAGNFGDDGEECGGTADQIGNWGGPLVTYRWDEQDDVSWKWLSVREIQPTASVPTDPGGGGVDNPTPPPNPTAGQVAQQTSHKFSIASFVVSTCDGEITNEPPSDPVPPNPPGTTPPSGNKITTYLTDYWKVP
jgi:hypothetical protein